MTYNEWNEAFSVEVEAIDKQHYKIIELIAELVEGFRDFRGDQIINDVLNDLKEYSVYHFGFEELLFMKYKYDNAEQHIGEHKKFIGKIEQLALDAQKNAVETPFETLVFLRSWLQTHILSADKEYVGFMKTKDAIKDIGFPESDKNKTFT